ncbi:hypothetical protein F6X40_17550 [Paraburkholderia sp. UCT31]|uniref:GSU2403 family nucleotidyltransferase fold protein n=1 Tax=Paraburkholderia sp. UCT31 TaxID=2615209 RepID=UPI0016556771|nr:GSU2403 family nucleotidyltransferase fold protein [Paraburkholderia sp. UCT31]MBC8738566.1 hypothetical protein [Paraburkholderia sp. UCT31]
MEFHELAMQTLFAEAVDEANTQEVIPLDSPGSPHRKTIKGLEYLYWRYYRAGKRFEESLGRADTPEAEEKLERKRELQRERMSLAKKAQLLRAAHYAAADNDAAVTIASIFNAGIFRNGGVLVGSHAFGALLNSLGLRPARNYQTTDIDIGTSPRIALGIDERRSLLEVLRESGLRFLEVPELDHRKQSTSFKVAGQPLKVDLLVPGTMSYESRPVPGLQAHATALPFFGYLMDEAIAGAVIGKDHIIPVRIPRPARFALHKLIVSTLRVETSAQKADKDCHQAVTLLEALLDRAPNDIEEARAALDEAARHRVANGAARAVRVVRPANVSEQLRDYLDELQQP